MSLAYLQTPSIAYTIPAEAHADSEARYQASALAKICCLPPNARPPSGAEGRHVHDGLVSMQGPNYALAKTMQLWRAALAYGRDGLLVSVNVAPPSRTASMTQGNKNAGTIAAFLDGAGHFAPNVVLDAETVAAVMAVVAAPPMTGCSRRATRRVRSVGGGRRPQCWHGWGSRGRWRPASTTRVRR